LHNFGQDTFVAALGEMLEIETGRFRNVSVEDAWLEMPKEEEVVEEEKKGGKRGRRLGKRMRFLRRALEGGGEGKGLEVEKDARLKRVGEVLDVRLMRREQAFLKGGVGWGEGEGGGGGRRKVEGGGEVGGRRQASGVSGSEVVEEEKEVEKTAENGADGVEVSTVVMLLLGEKALALAE
jgi:hypothetical protein